MNEENGLERLFRDRAVLPAPDVLMDRIQKRLRRRTFFRAGGLLGGLTLAVLFMLIGPPIPGRGPVRDQTLVTAGKALEELFDPFFSPEDSVEAYLIPSASLSGQDTLYPFSDAQEKTVLVSYHDL